MSEPCRHDAQDTGDGPFYQPPLGVGPAYDAPSLGAGSAGDVESRVLAEIVITVRDDHDWPTETDDGVVMRCRCGATPPSHLSGQQVDDALWLWRHQHDETGKALAAHVARASTADRERVARIEALADEWERLASAAALRSTKTPAARLRAALAAPHVEPRSS